MSLIQERKVKNGYDPDETFLMAYLFDSLGFKAKTDGNYMIVNHKGEQMQLRSKKMVWKTRGAAALALTNHLHGHAGRLPVDMLNSTGMTSEAYHKAVKERFKDAKEYRLWLEENKLITIVKI